MHTGMHTGKDWSNFAIQFKKILDAKLTVASDDLGITKEIVIDRSIKTYLELVQEVKRGNRILIEDKDGETRLFELELK